MSIRSRFTRTQVMRLGMLFLILANLAKLFLHTTPHFGEALADGVKGLLFGLAIGLLLLSIRMSSDCTGERA